MTYTLTVVLAVMLARGGFTGRAASIRMAIAAGSCSPRSSGSGCSPSC